MTDRRQPGSAGEAPPAVVVVNLHRRFTGISATIATLQPHLQQAIDIGLVDWGGLGTGRRLTLAGVVWGGFKPPRDGRFRVWHARRDIDMIIGIILRDILRQPWRLLFTSAANRRPGRILGWLIARMDAVVAASPYSAGFLDRSTRIIGHGVDTKRFRPTKDRGKAFAETRLPGRYLISCFGRVRHSKGTDLFVDAMIGLLPRFPDYTAIIAGDTRPRDAAFKGELERRIADAGLEQRIRFLGQLTPNDTSRWMMRTSLCIAPSRREGFGLTALEAMASGAAVITSKLGIWPQLVTSDSGCLFTTGDLDSLIEAIEPLLSRPDLLSDLGRCARVRARTAHSVDVEAEALCDLYRQLIGGECGQIGD